jgi:hypothetical protein
MSHAIDMDRLLWVLCRGVYALNNRERLVPQERLYLRVIERLLAERLEAKGETP